MQKIIIIIIISIYLYTKLIAQTKLPKSGLKEDPMSKPPVMPMIFFVWTWWSINEFEKFDVQVISTILNTNEMK